MHGRLQPQTRDTHLALVQDIADHLLILYRQSVLAIGLYGSMAREADGPSSNVKVFCILNDVEQWANAGGIAIEEQQCIPF